MADKKKKSKKFDYFNAFVSQVDLAYQEAQLLTDTIKNYKGSSSIKKIMEQAHEIEHAGDAVTHDVFTAITTDFITPIEREDIMSLTQLLDDILDYIEDVIQRFYMYDIDVMHGDVQAFAKIIEKSCKALSNVMDDFRNFKKSKNFQQKIIAVNTYEEEADVLYIEILRNLHIEKRDDPLYIMQWSQIFVRMEKCTDACERAADTMRSIMLKNS